MREETVVEEPILPEQVCVDIRSVLWCALEQKCYKGAVGIGGPRVYEVRPLLI